MEDLSLDEVNLTDAMDELESAEDFLVYFGIAYDPAVVRVNRLHILQRFHDYLAKAGVQNEQEDIRRATYASLLGQAYGDFVRSDALTEKVFKVFHMHEPQTAFVPLTALIGTSIGTGLTTATPAGGCGCGGQGACHGSEAALRS